MPKQLLGINELGKMRHERLLQIVAFLRIFELRDTLDEEGYAAPTLEKLISFLLTHAVVYRVA